MAPVETCARRRAALLTLTLCAVLLGTGPAARAGSYLDFELTFGPVGSEVTLDFATLAAVRETVILPDDESGLTTLLNGSYSAGDVALTWEKIEFDPDPIVSFVGGFSNLFAVATDFTLSTLSPIAPIPSSKIGGATTVTIADANFDGSATLKNVVGMPGYEATIDGTTALMLLDPFSISVPHTGGTAMTSDVLGLPGPTIPNGPVVATIGITHHLNVSALDNATYNSTFEVIIPEPGTALLLGFGLGGLALFRPGKRRT
jgi:hypothetical protein